jgi:ATP-dependent RNA helicase RhlE
VSADAIHGNKSQSARQRALSGFKSGEVRVLVATDIAARGIDVQGISHVVNYELPDEPESYVHRIGRTARAGRGGSAVAFCDPGERDQLRQIERLIKRAIPVGQVEGFVPPPPGQAEPERAERRFGGRGRGRGQRRAA